VYSEDRKLVNRMLAGDQRAFNAFFAAYAERLATFASRCIDGADFTRDAVLELRAPAELDRWKQEHVL
jgi:hypothetical protein